MCGRARGGRGRQRGRGGGAGPGSGGTGGGSLPPAPVETYFLNEPSTKCPRLHPERAGETAAAVAPMMPAHTLSPRCHTVTPTVTRPRPRVTGRLPPQAPGPSTFKRVYTERSPKTQTLAPTEHTHALNKITCNFEMFLRTKLLKHFGRKITASKCRRKWASSHPDTDHRTPDNGAAVPRGRELQALPGQAGQEGAARGPGPHPNPTLAQTLTHCLGHWLEPPPLPGRSPGGPRSRPHPHDSLGQEASLSQACHQLGPPCPPPRTPNPCPVCGPHPPWPRLVLPLPASLFHGIFRSP